jgi:Ca-activated chloride channel family protein
LIHLAQKITAVQNTLQTYINSLGSKDKLALIDFDTQIRPPVVIDGSKQGRDKGLEFVSGLKADGGTKLYDATFSARNWLQQNLRPDAINAVLILTDGEDSGSSTDQRIGFFTVGYGKEGEFNPQALEQIAKLNGGYYKKGDPETISKLMADLQVEF